MRFGVNRLAAASVLLIAAVIAAVVTKAAGVAEEPVFEISRFAIGGGGDTLSVGGGFELSGTIGQPEAGGLEGGEFTLTGGFWFEEPPGDCNGTGNVNLFDYSDFEACLSGPNGGLVAPYCACFDRDGDQDLDLLDCGEFQRSFAGG